MGGVSPAFKTTEEGQGVLLTPAVFKCLLVQNNQNAKVTYFGVTLQQTDDKVCLQAGSRYILPVGWGLCEVQPLLRDLAPGSKAHL